MGLAAEAAERQPSLILRKTSERISRAERREQANARVSTVKFPWGLEARLLNISDTGLLLESGTRIPPGSCQRLTLCGPDTEIEVPANFVRSEVALVNGLGVKYHIAVMFAEPVELDNVRKGTSVIPVRAKTLSHLLTQMGTELDQASRANRRGAIEHAVRRVLGARDVRIHEGSADSQDSGTLDLPLSVAGNAAGGVLRISFTPGLTLTDADLRLSRAAARLAAMVLEFDQGA